MWTLVLKELREHALVLAVWAVLVALLWLMVMLSHFLDESGVSVFVSFRAFLVVSSVISGLVLSHLLISREYSGKTQLFLEGLPLSRSAVFGVKWALFLCLLFLSHGLALAGTALFAFSSEPVDWRFWAIVSSQMLGWLLLVHGSASVFGLLGRYRVFLAGLFLLILVAVNSLTDLNLAEEGPFVLIDPYRFGALRDRFPVAALLWSGGVWIAFTLFCLVMVQAREGSLAAALAVKMSYREKIFAAAALVGGLIALITLDVRKQPVPFTLVNASELSSAGVSVSVSEGAFDGEGLQQWLHEELVATSRYLEVSRLPPLFVTFRVDLDGDKYERANLDERAGVLVRINPGGQDWNREAFLTWLIPHLLDEASYGRTTMEHNAFLLDALAHLRGEGRIEEEHILLRALYGAESGLREEDLKRWYRVREQKGTPIASALAGFAMRRFAESHGEETLRRLMVRRLQPRADRDFRTTLYDWQNSLEEVIANLTDRPLSDHLVDWNRELAERRAVHSETLGALPRLRGEARLVPLSESSHVLEYRATEPLEPRERVSFHYAEIDLDTAEIIDHRIVTEERPGEQLEQWRRFPKTASRGERLAWSLTIDSEILGCELGTGWQRLEVPR